MDSVQLKKKKMWGGGTLKIFVQKNLRKKREKEKKKDIYIFS